MEEDRFMLFQSESGFGLRILTALGDTFEYPCVSYNENAANMLLEQMRGAGLDPAHYDDVVRDYITGQYLEQLALNRLM